MVREHQTHWEGLDRQIIALYARNMTVRDIQEQLQEIYGLTDELKPCLYVASGITEPPPTATMQDA